MRSARRRSRHDAGDAMQAAFVKALHNKVARATPLTKIQIPTGRVTVAELRRVLDAIEVARQPRK